MSLTTEKNDNSLHSSTTILPDAEEDVSEQDESILSEKEAAKLIFFTPLALKCIQRKTSEIVKRRYTAIGQKYNMCFKMIKSDSKLVKTILYSYGFLQCSSKNQNCNLFWTNTHVSAHVLRSLRSWQRMNHFPRSFMITKKDTLYECIDRAMVQYGNCFDFIPDYFCTPLSDSKKEKVSILCREIEDDLAAPFIVKPACSSRGRDITFLRCAEDVEKLDGSAKLLISRYIDRPFLINKLKCDLRVYVLVTSFYPLIVYVYSDGLARFAVHVYDEENRKNYSDVNTHLTNYSLNKSSTDFIKNSDVSAENVGHKWTLGAFLREMERQGVDTNMLMVRIEDIVIKTLLSIQGSVAASCRKFNIHPKCCFELFGFDILVDENLKPWLLEVNLSPSLACDAPLDSILKTHLLCDTLNIASIPLVCERNTLNRCTSSDEEELGPEQNVDNGQAKVEDSSLARASFAAIPSTSTEALLNGNATKAEKPKDINQDKDSAESVNNNNSLPSPSPMNANTRKRKFANLRATKVRKAQFSCKPTFSANCVTPQYLARAKCHFEKLETEALRKGRFVRIFPRSTTWDLYSTILEDVGQEKWDMDLHLRLNQGLKMPEISIREVEMAHTQLINAKMYPSQADLSPNVRDVILKQALTEADKYKMRMYSADIKPYPSALPFVRMEARRRTKSQTVAEESRRAYLINKRQEQQQQQVKDQQPAEHNSNPKQKAVETENELVRSASPAKVDDVSEVTTNVTIVLNDKNTSTQGDCEKNDHSVLEQNGTSTCARVDDQSNANGSGISKTFARKDDEKPTKQQQTALSEVNLNFIIKKAKDGSAIVLEENVEECYDKNLNKLPN